ncbi:MAG: T9SS type A sorting domain-containing protein [Bacteroidetes bacterium]|nr:T9SS type A sorting domain-containing protein [Bacteroidota bacterium]
MSKNIGVISGLFKEQINLNTLPNGIYFVEVALDGITKTIRVVKN